METIFYHPDYLHIQAHEKLKIFENSSFKVIFSLKNELAHSMPKGLFGSIQMKKSNATYDEFEEFWGKVVKGLKAFNVSKVEVVHPNAIYEGFVSDEWMDSVGFSTMYSDIHHHIVLGEFSLHKMEQRKLKSLGEEKFRVSKDSNKDLGMIYDFLSACRAQKNMKINIQKEKLVELVASFPDRYDLFTGRLDGQLACAAITLRTAEKVAYYYLAGTSEQYKKASPMVGLLDGIVGYYSSKLKFLDLGISSIEGKPQEGLVAFKTRMGGIKSYKHRFTMNI